MTLFVNCVQNRTSFRNLYGSRTHRTRWTNRTSLPRQGYSMVVRTNKGRLGMTGLHVGDGNVQRLFPPNMPRVELQLDHLRIVCTLQPEFWKGTPEIHDNRLDSWLESKRVSGKLASAPSPLAMIPVGDHAFRLQPIDHSEESRTEYAVGFSG